MNCRVYYKPDKSVIVVYVSSKSKLSESYSYDRHARLNGLDGLPYDEVDSSTLPQTREHRNAWEGEKGKSISINQFKIQPKPKTIEERLIALEAK